MINVMSMETAWFQPATSCLSAAGCYALQTVRKVHHVEVFVHSEGKSPFSLGTCMKQCHWWLATHLLSNSVWKASCGDPCWPYTGSHFIMTRWLEHVHVGVAFILHHCKRKKSSPPPSPPQAYSRLLWTWDPSIANRTCMQTVLTTWITSSLARQMD